MSVMVRSVLGIDVGGSSIKGGLVDIDAGLLQGELVSVATPRPAAPEPVMQAVANLAATMALTQAAGVAFPSVVQGGRARTAAHIDPSWIDVDGAALATRKLGRRAVFLNDADAAGLAAAQTYGGYAGNVPGIAGSADAAVNAFTLMKVIGRDVWIGVWAFVLSIVAISRWESTGVQTKAGAGEIWRRLQKFVLGFLLASVVITLVTHGYSYADY